MFENEPFGEPMTTPVKHYDPATFGSHKSLGYLLKINHSVMGERLERLFANRDISFVQWIALRKLNEGAAMTASELCRKMCHDNGAVTRLLDQLEQRGYIVRERSREDRRVVNLQITDAGRLQISELTPDVVHALNTVLETFSAEEFGELTRLLEKLQTRLQHLSAEPITDTPS